MTCRVLPASALGALIGAMIVFPVDAAAAARNALGAWAQAVVPSLGPFMACGGMRDPRKTRGRVAKRAGQPIPVIQPPRASAKDWPVFVFQQLMPSCVEWQA